VTPGSGAGSFANSIAVTVSGDGEFEFLNPSDIARIDFNDPTPVTFHVPVQVLQDKAMAK